MAGVEGARRAPRVPELLFPSPARESRSRASGWLGDKGTTRHRPRRGRKREQGVVGRSRGEGDTQPTAKTLLARSARARPSAQRLSPHARSWEAPAPGLASPALRAGKWGRPRPPFPAAVGASAGRARRTSAPGHTDRRAAPRCAHLHSLPLLPAQQPRALPPRPLHRSGLWLHPRTPGRPRRARGAEGRGSRVKRRKCGRPRPVAASCPLRQQREAWLACVRVC